MMPMKFFAMGSAMALLAACAVQHTDGSTKPEEVSGGLFGLSKAEDLNVETPAAFKGQKTVVIGGFQVVFLEEKRASNKAGGGLLGNGFGGKSSANMDLKNIDATHMQAITETVYADFLAKLQAAGYSVADRAPLLAHEDFKGVSSDASPMRSESSFFGGDVTQTAVAPKAIGKLYNGGFAFANSMTGAALYADKTKTPVLFVTYTVDFANKAGGHGGYWSSSSSVEVGQGMSVPAGSGVTIIGGQGGTFSSAIGSVKLGQPLFSEEKFAEVSNTNSDEYVAAEAAVNVLGLLGGIGSNQSRAFDVNADPVKYQAVASKVLTDTNAKLIDKMTSLR